MSDALQSRLREAGISCRVEARDRLAIVIPETAGIGGDDRLLMTQIAREQGFTHVAIELDPDGAPLPGD
jgi:hypothetical protein